VTKASEVWTGTEWACHLALLSHKHALAVILGATVQYPYSPYRGGAVFCWNAVSTVLARGKRACFGWVTDLSGHYGIGNAALNRRPLIRPRKRGCLSGELDNPSPRRATI